MPNHFLKSGINLCIKFDGEELTFAYLVVHLDYGLVSQHSFVIKLKLVIASILGSESILNMVNGLQNYERKSRFKCKKKF